MRALLSVCLAIVFWASYIHAADGDAILGVWNTQDREVQFEIYKCGPEYCGRIYWLREPDYPPASEPSLAGRPKMDRKNPEITLRTRPLLGLTIFRRLRYDGENSWRGTVYNPEDGDTYKCILSLDDGNRLKVRGYYGFVLFGHTQIWTSAAVPDGTGN